MRSAQGTPSWLGAVNDRVGLSALLDHGPLTRNRICELVGVSKPTASMMMNRLIAAGVIEERGQVAGNPGRSATLYAARTDRPLGVAIVIEADELRAAVVDAAGGERPIVRTPLSRDPADRDAVREVAAAIRDASAAAGTDPSVVHTVCIGTAGYVDPGEEGTLFSETLPGWPVSGLRRILEAELGVAVFVENDVNLAAIAERQSGAGEGRDVFALLWLGNGVGASFDVAGDLHRGSFGGAGEIGFLPLSAAAQALDEHAVTSQDLAGAVAVRRIAAAHGLDDADHRSALDAIAASPERAAIVEEIGARVAHVSLPLLATLDPGRLVLAGPTAIVGGQPLAEAVERGIRSISRWYPEVVATRIDHDPVLHGARAFLTAKVRDDLLGTVARLSLS
ncbi:putative NBD/HSP70 family sugar kinase [Agromyces hippuratus]|uniref:Putative NBD/HSP70 family sugar kinase n=1 Tax=Agromyces hippuratus TaxID=286438 RepID=A0A852WZJ1_9MICO|nr:ROK family transcriptional regulator [Agromyces hippuratus]NYG19351.1 putative NBD/HSP70 family sugar kinase [Agromyces hippuratus]